MKALSFILSILLSISSGSANPSAESISYTVTLSAIRDNFHREQGGPFGSINKMKLSPCDVGTCCVTKYCYSVSPTGQVTLVELASAPCPDLNTIDCSIQSGCSPQTYKVCGDD